MDRHRGATGAHAPELKRMEEWIVGRLADLEARNRSLRRRVALLTLLLLMSMGLAGAALYLSPALPFGPATPQLIASSFTLQDGEGNVRGEWTVRDDGAARMAFTDREGIERLRMTVLGGGAPGLVFADRAGDSRIVLGVLPDETTSLVFADNGGATRAVLGVAADQSANLVFADRSGAMRSALGTDALGQPTFLLPEASDLPADVQAPPDSVEAALPGG